MDIASVYLNLASLLGTQIELEGYYAAGLRPGTTFLYSIEHERDSERILLPLYIGHKNLINTYNAPPRVKLVFKGTLAQNAHGDLCLRHITSISYKTDVVFFNVALTYDDQQIVCRQSLDFVFNWAAYFQAQHKPINDLTLVSSILSVPVLLDGYLLAYRYNPPDYDVRVTLAVKELVYEMADLWRHNQSPSPSDVLQLLVGRRLPWDKTGAKQDPEYVEAGWHCQIWIPKTAHATPYLDAYFAASQQPEGDWRSEDDTKFTFAGVIEALDEADRENKGLTPKVRSKLTTIDYIAARRTIIYKRSEDER